MNNYVYFLFTILLLFGTLKVGDYGISIDEPIERKHGIVAFDYVNEKFGLFPSIPRGTEINLVNYDHRDYGLIFQFTAYSLELIFNINNSKEVFLLRHLLVFLLFWVSLIFFYKIIEWRYKDWKIGLVGVIFFLLSPRLFADSFYNPKDIPLMSFFIISAFTMVNFFFQPTKLGAIWHGVACGLVVGTRIVGVYMPIFTLLLILFRIYQIRSSSQLIRDFLLVSSIFIFSLCLSTLIFWPILWEDPIGNLLYSFNSMKKFRWYGNILFWGQMVNSNNLPWYYIPSWILVTTPISIVLFFCAGIFSISKSLYNQKWSYLKSRSNQMDLIFLGLFLGPLIAVIIFNSVLYNGWRHLYFIYPFFLLIGMRGFMSLFLFVRSSFLLKKRIFVSGILSVFIVFNLIQTLVFMFKNHPHQNVYFNELVRNVEHNFERDYYGLSYKQALKYLLEKTDDDSLMIYSHDFIGKINTMNFPKKEAERLHFVSNLNDADYFMSLLNPRDEKEKFEMINKNSLYNNPEFFNIKVSGYRIISIYKLEREN